MRVFHSRDDGNTWNVAHTFPAGEIFHIHGIQYDRYRDGYGVMTGDRDEESHLHFTSDGFRTLQTLGGGTQSWRIISLLITPDALFWGNDDDQDGAGIFVWNFQSGTLERLLHIGSPAYYAQQLSDGLLAISTAFEPLSDYTRSSGAQPRTDLWISRDGSTWRTFLHADARPFTGQGSPHRGRLVMPLHPADKLPSSLVIVPFHTVPARYRTYVIEPGSRQSGT